MADAKRRFNYPETRKDDLVEDYHGAPVADPYRWMEDPESSEVIAWCEAQNALTTDYLAEIPARARIHARLTALWDFARFDTPLKKGDYTFYLKNDGLQNQYVLYKQQGLDGAPEVLLDPNALSADGTVALMDTSFTKDGGLMAYSLSDGGSDWQIIRIRDVETGQDYDEALDWLKFSGMAWKEDGSGFFYNRYPEMEDRSATPFNSQVCWHKVGTPQSQDVLVYQRPDAKELGFIPHISDDGAYLLLHVWHGSVNRNRVYYRPVESQSDFVRLLDDADAAYDFVGNNSATFFFETDLDAPKGRIIAIDIANPARENWREMISEGDDTILFARVVYNHLVVVYMHNAYHQVKIYTLEGAFVRDAPLPGMGSVIALSSKHGEGECFINFQSYLSPSTIFRYDLVSGALTPWQRARLGFPLDEYETTQVFTRPKTARRSPCS